MRCAETRSLLSPFLDGELGRSESEAVRAHLVDCARCRAEASDLRSISKFFAEDEPTPPTSPGFTDAVMSRLRSGEGLEERRAERVARITVLAAAAVVLLSVGFLATPRSMWKASQPTLEAGLRGEVEREIRRNDLQALPIDGTAFRKPASQPARPR